MTRVLVAYATRHGSTAEIAQAIGRVLGDSGCQAEVVPAADVGEVSSYDAVVIGSAVYMGHWQKEAMNLLKRHERHLRARPTWLFSSGPTGGTPDSDAVVQEAKASPEAVPPVKEVAARSSRIDMRGHATFPGRVGDEMTGLLERWLPRGDWREFGDVEAWAGRIADAALQERPAASYG